MYLDSKRKQLFDSIHQSKENTMNRNSNNWMQHKYQNNNIMDFPAWEPFQSLKTQRGTSYSQTQYIKRQEPEYA